MPERPDHVYAARAARFAASRNRYALRWGRIANLRLVAFVAALAAAGAGWWRDAPWLIWLGAAGGVAFLALVAYHRYLGDLRRRYTILHDLSADGLLRLRRDWAALPLRRPPPPATPDATAFDLDLLGQASLQHLLSTPQTHVGQATLQGWLLRPAAPAVIRARQEAVAELATAIDLRDEIALLCRLAAEGQPAYERFTAWAAGPPSPLGRPAIRALTIGSPALLVLAAAAQAAGLTPWPLWLAFLGLNIILTIALGAYTLEPLAQLYDRHDLLAAYSRLLGLAADAPAAAPELRRIQAELAAGGLRADAQLRRLSAIATLAEYSRSILYPLLQFGLLWSFQVIALAEGWRRISGPRLGPWLAAVGDLEALAALAALRHDNPGWAFPTLVEGGPPTIIARGLGHPLLPPERCVTNDVQIGPPGRFLLITGSNMSGKSTFLRAVGMNVALAQAGGPVCAAELRLPPITLATSMRVQDSLAQGVSYFMAELRRLREIVDAAEAAHAAGGPVVCYLLDEILHGTNSAERQIAARRVIRHLVSLGAIGAVSTHDLALADDGSIAASADLAHFREQIAEDAGGATMRFDYTLRPGIAATTNALRLMELVGLPVGEPSCGGQNG
ncbi:hypothetical protein K2Z83_07320 [Oscillochloris sp. ZM17-4]|uniref:MutS family DNA mismatch repair protein n=1 Tax=Oscillochloris sp. ZM17-4 TaxID=2866714 RepID=UPI001C73730B|nr:MutS family DNA mismatch repair protein [Oscillochloris sp. ZM17-4]MBX0327487.1 hypothetical protein [Oscillochloris sp. ZM17-4]